MSASSQQQQQHQSSFPHFYPLTPTATSTSLTTLPVQRVRTGRGQLRHTCPQTAASSAASFGIPPATATTSAPPTANRSESGSGSRNGNTSNTTNKKTGTLPTLPPRRIQFAGDILEDWLFADSALNLSLNHPPSTLTSSLIASKLDRLPNHAPQPPRRHTRSSGSSSSPLSTTTITATHSAPTSTAAPHVPFIDLPTSHNVHGALKRKKLRSASPFPAPAPGRGGRGS